MLGALIRILPTLWPFLLEIIGFKSNKTRGGVTKSPARRAFMFSMLIYFIMAIAVYDITWRLYRENHHLVIQASEDAASAKHTNLKIVALEAELSELKRDHIVTERDLSAANAKLDFAIYERQRLEGELKEERAKNR